MLWLMLLVTAQAARLWPIESLAVTGARHLSPEQVLAVAGLKKGDKAGQTEFEAARNRLLATGYFASVGYRFEPAAGGKGYAARFEVAEIEPLYPVRFEDLPLAEQELRETLRRSDPLFGARIPATQAVIERYARAIEARLAQAGRKEAVAGAVAADPEQELAVLFRPAAPPPRVAEVRFRGNSVIPSPVLQNRIASVAVGTAFSERRFRQLLDANIRPLYEARGRIRVAFLSVKAEPARDVKGLAVTVELSEGPSYNLGQVRVTGSPVPEEELLKAAGLTSGDLANFDDVEAACQRIAKRLRHRGYMKPQTRPERQVNDQAKVIDLRIAVEPGPRYSFGLLKVEGLDIHSEPVVRRLWAIKEGQPFDADYPEFFLARVREDGLFDNLGQTRSAIQVDDQALKVDVTLYFR